jgi:hypothetical protein
LLEGRCAQRPASQGRKPMNVDQLVIFAAILTAIAVCFPKEVAFTLATALVFLMILGLLSIVAAVP